MTKQTLNKVNQSSTTTAAVNSLKHWRCFLLFASSRGWRADTYRPPQLVLSYPSRSCCWFVMLLEAGWVWRRRCSGEATLSPPQKCWYHHKKVITVLIGCQEQF